MLKRWAAWPLGIRWLAGTAALVLAAAIVWVMFVPLADGLAHHDVGSATGALYETALDNARGRLLTLGAGLVASGALVFTALNFNLLRRNSEQTDQWQRRTHELTEQGQVTDRFTKAIEQLGSDKLDVRIGSIYALERVARDSTRDHPTIMEVLAAFIREHSREPWPPETGSNGRTVAALRALSGPARTRRPGRAVLYLAARSSSSPDNLPERARAPRPDVQAAVTVVGRRDAERDASWPIDLTGANLAGALLARAHLTHVDLTGADLTGANFYRADLSTAILWRANLTGARLVDADLAVAVLAGADLTDADLTDAHLDGADLRDADLTGVYLANEAFTSGRAPFTSDMWPPGALGSESWMADSSSGRLKRAGQLSGVTAHYL